MRKRACCFSERSLQEKRFCLPARDIYRVSSERAKEAFSKDKSYLYLIIASFLLLTDCIHSSIHRSIHLSFSPILVCSSITPSIHLSNEFQTQSPQQKVSCLLVLTCFHIDNSLFGCCLFVVLHHRHRTLRNRKGSEWLRWGLRLWAEGFGASADFTL